MTPRWTRLALGAFVVLSSGFTANVFLLQTSGRGTAWRGQEPPTGLAFHGGSQTGSTETGAPASAWSRQLATHNGSGATPAPAAGDNAELTRAIQRELKGKGYETGAVDGVAGLVTRAAIMAYEADRGLPLTGQPRQELLQDIVLGRAAFVPDASKTASAPGPGAELVIRSVQRSLASLGYGSEEIDGRMSEGTIRAVRKFEGQQGMRETGRISGELVARLARLSGERGTVGSP